MPTLSMVKILEENKSYAIQSALTCKGWTDSNKLSRLFDLVKETENLAGDILEIGSAWGRSTVLLGLASKKRIWSIDPHTGGLAYIQKGENQNSFNEFSQNLSKHGLSDRVVILKNTTRDVIDLNLVSDSIRFSFVFIDGLHTAEGVQTDFELAYPRLVSSGIMAFDDYFEPGVKEYTAMIDKLVSKNAVTLIKDNSGLVFFYKN